MAENATPLDQLMLVYRSSDRPIDLRVMPLPRLRHMSAASLKQSGEGGGPWIAQWARVISDQD